MLTLLEVVQRTTEFFAKNGIESARLNAELIAAHALGLNRMQVYLQFERPLDDGQLETIRALVRRRGKREPLAYVLGTAAFGDLTLTVDRRVLVPRPETEQLVERISETLSVAPESWLDLGTGSGAIALSLATRYLDSKGIAVDTSEEALVLARENALRAGVDGRVDWRQSDWFSTIDDNQTFDLIVSNPPYLTEAEWSAAEPEVREHEPRVALVADDEGCADLVHIITEAPKRLRPGGWLFLETGIDQHARLLEAAREAGFTDAHSHQDWSGRDRFISARKP